MYAVMSLCGTTIYSLLPIVIIEQIGKESLVTVLGIFYVYQAMAFIVSTLVASKFIIIVLKVGSAVHMPLDFSKSTRDSERSNSLDRK